MDLSGLKSPKGQKHKQRRVGRGMGSGRGKTSAAAERPEVGFRFGQKRGFEGGQMPLHRRLPKRGFTNIFKKEYAVINVGRLGALEATSSRPRFWSSWASSRSWVTA